MILQLENQGNIITRVVEIFVDQYTKILRTLLVKNELSRLKKDGDQTFNELKAGIKQKKATVLEKTPHLDDKEIILRKKNVYLTYTAEYDKQA